MILLDTNILSEVLRPLPDIRVERWLDSQPDASLFTSAITEAELWLGVALMPLGHRRTALAVAIRTILADDFSGRILPFDSPAAAFADVLASRRRSGRPMSQSDAQIAAIARSRGMTAATRNVRDFEGCGITVVNPWTEAGRD